MKFPKVLLPRRMVTIKPKQSNQGRKHLNKKFYTSYKWTKFRKGYIQHLSNNQLSDIPGIDLPEPYKLELLDNIPVCEECYRNYTRGFQPGVNMGRELDHIKPLNPIDAYLVNDIYGEPLDYNNVQLLCNRCHSEKSGRDKAFHNKLKQTS